MIKYHIVRNYSDDSYLVLMVEGESIIPIFSLSTDYNVVDVVSDLYKYISEHRGVENLNNTSIVFESEMMKEFFDITEEGKNDKWKIHKNRTWGTQGQNS